MRRGMEHGPQQGACTLRRFMMSCRRAGHLAMLQAIMILNSNKQYIMILAQTHVFTAHFPLLPSHLELSLSVLRLRHQGA